MRSMTVERTIGLPVGRELTVEDLAAMPDDGHRYELLEGVLLVSPAPSWAHQEAVMSLVTLLRPACPDDLRVMIAPFAVRLTGGTELQPDLLVARCAHMTEKFLPAAPVLAVEVLSPSTALVDLNLKRAAYQEFGVRSYWIVDPDLDKPSATALELSGGGYVEVARAFGDDWFHVEHPFPVELRPVDLIRLATT